MQKARIALALVPGRAEPAHASEMTTQWHFGEVLEVLEEIKDWARVVSYWDGYSAWIRTNQMEMIASDELVLWEQPVVNKAFEQVVGLQGESLWLSFGAWLPKGSPSPLAKSWQALAAEWMHAPYLWGGKSPLGVDCSGLMQMLWRSKGVPLPRDAKDQADMGIPIPWLNESQLGDLAFFENEVGEIHHVGLLMGNGHILHASGAVRMDNIDQQGIFRRDIRKYTHKLRLIQRLV